MLPFLQQIAQNLLAKHGNNLADICLVFPNRRATFFFRRFLGESAQEGKPIWSPTLLSFDELVMRFTNKIKTDKLTLIFELFEAYNYHYKQVFDKEQTFEKFYFWGEMLLKDFEEIDKNMITPTRIFEDLSEQKELDYTFEDFLEEEQKELISSFWSNFKADERGSEYRRQFLEMWRFLPDVYQTFQERLTAKGRAYEGMIYREVAQKLLKNNVESPFKKVIFIGFSGLGRCEEAIIQSFVKNGGEAYWDIDAYYTADKKQEAGLHFRKLNKNAILRETLPKGDTCPKHFNPDTNPKSIELIGVPLEAAQGKVVGELLEQLESPDTRLNTLVLVPSQPLLFPLLHALPQKVQNVNVTMGYPLRNTPVYSLLQHLMSLQKTAKTASAGQALFFHQPILALLRHPYIIYYNSEKAIKNIQDIEESNRVYMSLYRMKEQDEFYSLIFRKVNTSTELFEYLLTLFESLARYMRVILNEDKHTIEEEYLFTAHTQVQRLATLFDEKNITVPVDNAWLLIRKLLESQSIPFTGEPLEGLQIMGLLESQTLDFENVIIPAMNEGQLPPTPPQGSFIPMNIRRAYGLNSPEDHDALYAYYFYRLLHKAKRIFLIYNTETTSQLKSEVSRFAYQIEFEMGYNIKKRTVVAKAMPLPSLAINVPKTAEVATLLRRFLVGEGDIKRRLTPSAINTYLNCSLQFYFSQIAQLREPETVSEVIDASTFGNLLHETMEFLYVNLRKEKKNKHVEVSDFEKLNNAIPVVFDKVFKREFDIPEGEKIDWEGTNLIIKNIIFKYVKRILELDKTYAPFDIIALESGRGYEYDFPISLGETTEKVQLKGIIDRIDLKNDLIRVLDYKTGDDKIDFKDIDEIFAGGAPKKAIMQAFFYGMLFHETQPQALIGRQLSVGLLLTRKIFDSNYNYEEDYKVSQKIDKKKQVITDITEKLNDFKQGLSHILSDIFDENKSFSQTSDEKRCIYCAYKSLCHR